MIWFEVSKDVIYRMALFASYGLEAKVKQWTDSFLEFKLYNRLHLNYLVQYILWISNVHA